MNRSPQAGDRFDAFIFAGITVPIFAFIEKEAGLNVGLQYTREWGGKSDTANAAGIFEGIPAEDSLKIVTTKTFSLMGK